MMRKSTEHLEFERSRKDILKMSGKDPNQGLPGREEEKKYAWEIELEEYRSRKRLDRFLIFGAMCGIASLIISLYVLMNFVIV